MQKNFEIYVIRYRSLVESEILKNLERKGYGNFSFHTHIELDLFEQKVVANFIYENQND